MNTDYFLQGQRDCKNGIPHRSGIHEDYDRGYAVEYERQEALTAMSDWGMMEMGLEVDCGFK